MGGSDSLLIRHGTFRRFIPVAAAMVILGLLIGHAHWRPDADSALGGRGSKDPLRIAIVFLAVEAQRVEIDQDMTQTVATNLERDGAFKAIDVANFKEKVKDFNKLPQFADWRAINAQVLVTGRTIQETDDRIRTEYRLWDVAAGQHLRGQRYVTSNNNHTLVANVISDAIRERLAGRHAQ
jgi:TolB protein